MYLPLLWTIIPGIVWTFLPLFLLLPPGEVREREILAEGGWGQSRNLSGVSRRREEGHKKGEAVKNWWWEKNASPSFPLIKTGRGGKKEEGDRRSKDGGHFYPSVPSAKKGMERSKMEERSPWWPAGCRMKQVPRNVQNCSTIPLIKDYSSSQKSLFGGTGSGEGRRRRRRR